MSEAWKIVCDEDVFDRLKSQTSFGHVMALGRAVNALRFIHSSFKMDGSPDAQRSRINVFFFASSVLCEGFRAVKNMEPEFASNTVFAAELLPLLDDSTAQMIRDLRIKRIRNKGVFHFDAKEFRKLANRSPRHACTVATGWESQGDTYYQFADAIVVDMFMGKTDGVDSDYVNEASLRIPAVKDLTVRFSNAAELFILSCLKEWGFTKMPETTEQ